MNRSALVSKLLGIAGVAATLVSARAGLAEPLPPVDVVIHDAPQPRRIVSVEWNPLPTFTIGKASANVVVVPMNHHALVLSPFYVWTNTAPIVIFDDTSPATAAAPTMTQLPMQKFRGFGAEIGYRYYVGEGGPRGFFVGPSFILGSFNVTAADRSETHYLDYGLAVDAGYEMLVADRLSLTFGGGLQVTTPSKSIPEQQFPANLYANTVLRPRLLLSLGWAL